MDFVRKNIFYVALLGLVFVALIVVLVVVPDASTQDKSRLLSRIETLQRAQPPVNEITIQTERTRIEKTVSQVNGVINMCIERNKKDFKVVEYPGTQIPVFPFNKAVYDQHQAYEVTLQYKEMLKSMAGALNSTIPPTPEDVAREAKRQDTMLRISGTSTTNPAVTGAVAPTYSSGGGSAADFASPAGNAVRAQKASAGVIYIPEGYLDLYFPKAVVDVSPNQLWEMQLNLAVHNEIFSAIGSTIDFVLQGTSGASKAATVPNSPVKMLCKVDIAESYVVHATALAAGGATVPGVGGFGGNPNGNPASPAGGFGGPAAAAASDPNAVTGASLGERTSNKDYDVIGYSFQVVMPVRYVPLLERKLMDRNFNTVVSTEMSGIDFGSPTFAPCYFGSDPVMLVTIRAQLLLLTDWERGSWETDKDGKTVEKYPPLMPVEVLKTLPADALRPVDVERLKKPA